MCRNRCLFSLSLWHSLSLPISQLIPETDFLHPPYPHRDGPTRLDLDKYGLMVPGCLLVFDFTHTLGVSHYAGLKFLPWGSLTLSLTPLTFSFYSDFFLDTCIICYVVTFSTTTLLDF